MANLDIHNAAEELIRETATKLRKRGRATREEQMAYALSKQEFHSPHMKEFSRRVWGGGDVRAAMRALGIDNGE